jgi:PKD repeat protein
MPVAAQGYCAHWVDTLLDTSDSCVNEPWRERAMGIQNLRWKGHDYVILNRGNELSFYKIDNPTDPGHVATSSFRFGTRGDSDYDLLDFDVCDDCRYGIFAHKVAGTVIFDLGTGGEPSFSRHYAMPATDLFAGGYTFQRGGQQYLLTSTLANDCGTFGTGLYASGDLGAPGFIECVEIAGEPVFVKGLHPYDVGGALYLYVSDGAGQSHVFRADGGGLALNLAYLSSPPTLKARPYTFSIDADNARAVSGRSDKTGGEVTFWDLSSPGSPQAERTLPVVADIVSLRSPGAGSAASLFIARQGDFGSERAYTVGDGPPNEFAEGFWSDRDLPHNQLPGCGFPASSALSPDGSTLYLSRNAILQVFDLADCLAPTQATANLTVTPSSVYPGESVTVIDGSTGQIDRWALWITEEPGGAVVAGTKVPSAANPHQISFQVPQDLAAGTGYRAHIVVESDGLPPDVPAYDKWIAIQRAPTVAISVDPEAVIVGESVSLLATVSGGTPTSYQWEIWAPGASTPDTRTGATVPSLTLSTPGQWTFNVTAAYDHEASVGVPYQATDTLDFAVTSVAADFTISPSSPLHTQTITLDGSGSKPIGGDLDYAWQVESLYHSYTDCGASAQCIIPAESLNPDTTYNVTLTVTNNADSATSSIARPLFVGNGNIQPTIGFSPANPDIGQTVVFTINGVPGDIESASWSMGGPGCDGADSTPECTPDLWIDCKNWSYKYATSSAKTVSLTVVVAGNTFTAPNRTVTVASDGSCSGGGPGPTCTYSLGSSNVTFGPVGGESTFRVNTSSGCDWTAATNASWIEILPPTGSRSGSGTVNYRVYKNTGPQLGGTIVAAGEAFSVTQNAPYVAANFTMSTPFPEIGEVMTVTVDPILQVVSWNFGEANCNGGSPSINCSFLPPGACNNLQWTYAKSGQKSITMVLSDGRTQTKNPTVKPTGECCFADGRPDASFIMSTTDAYVGDRVVFTDTSSDSAAKMSKALGFTWSPFYPEIGQNTTFSLAGVTGDIARASWDFGEVGCDGKAAVQECVPDLWNDCKAITFAFASSGPKPVSVDVEIGGNTETVGPNTVDVANAGSCSGGSGGCSYTLSPTSDSFSFAGGSGSFDVNTAADCEWEATTNASWLTIESGGGTGPGSVDYTVEANTGLATRTGTIRVEGRLFKVTQTGDQGDIEPTEWRWTITRIEGEEGEPVNQEVFTSTDQHTSYRFEELGLYRVTLIAANCFGSDTTLDHIRVEEAPVEDFVVGAAVSMAGANNTQWESDFRFHNPCGEDLDVRIEYQPENTNNAGAELEFRVFQLFLGETRVFPHITDAIPGLGDEQISGSVRIESTSDSGCKVLSVSRTFNDTPDGSLGLFVPALPVERVGLDFLDLNGLISNQDYRTNLRLVNYSDEDVWVPLTAYDRNGSQVGERRSTNVRGQSTKQINEIAGWLGVTGNLAPFAVRAEISGYDVQAFGTVVDNLTGDSVLYLSSFQDENKIWLVGVASLSGVNNSLWRTDLWLYNPTGDWLPGEVEFVVGDNPSDSYGFAWPNLGTLRTKQYLDIVSDQLGLEETRGYIVLTGADGGPAPQVAARTYNLDPTGGTYGLNLRAFGSNDLLQPGETGYIAGISNSSDQGVGFRTNVGILNTDRNGWTTVRMTMYNLDGSQAAEPYETNIAPGKLRQFDIFKKLGLGNTDMTGSLVIEAVSGGAMAVYATEIDNRTQDSIFIPAQRKFLGLAPQ